jgi:hypothetical protein
MQEKFGLLVVLHTVPVLHDVLSVHCVKFILEPTAKPYVGQFMLGWHTQLLLLQLIVRCHNNAFCVLSQQIL